MPSYIPEHRYGLIPGTYDQYGLIPWPAHMRPREPLPDINIRELFEELDACSDVEAPPLPRLAEADGVFFLTLAKGDRASVAYTIERLIDMLDAMEAAETDPDFEYSGDEHDYSRPEWSEDIRNSHTLHWCEDSEESDPAEPWLGAPERHPGGGWGRETRADRREHSQEHWTCGGEHDHAYNADREEQCEDEGSQCEDEGANTGDDEYSLGWQHEGSQSVLRGGEGDYEADLGTTEEVDQVRRLEFSNGEWPVQDGEPWLGWAESHGRGITGEQDCVDDRERDNDDLEPEVDGGGEECSGESLEPIPGGGSVCQWEDGWRPVPGTVAPPPGYRRVRRSRKAARPTEPILNPVSSKPAPDELTILRPGVAMVGGYLESPVMRTLEPRDDDLIPEIDLRAHFLAAHGQRP